MIYLKYNVLLSTTSFWEFIHYNTSSYKFGCIQVYIYCYYKQLQLWPWFDVYIFYALYFFLNENYKKYMFPFSGRKNRHFISQINQIFIPYLLYIYIYIFDQFKSEICKLNGCICYAHLGGQMHSRESPNISCECATPRGFNKAKNAGHSLKSATHF